MTERKTIDLEQGWDVMQKGMTKLKNILEGLPEPQFSSEEYMTLYVTIYNMCTQKPPHDYSQQLYDKYRESFEEYITSTVLPSLREKHDEFMLRELVRRWSNHKVMVRLLSRFFHYLDRYFIARRSLPALNEVGLACFRDLVYQEVNGKVRDAVISLIDQEREGEQIDRALLKNVLDIFVEIGMGQMEYYENDFEASMLKDTAAYYSRKASNWILEDSCPDYMLKAEECLKREKDRVSHYLHFSSEPKLLEKVQHELSVYATQLLEKEHSGCHALLRDDKVEDLSRMYRLFSKIPRGLDPVSSMFKQHVTAEGTTLVKQAEDAASNKKAEKRDVVGLQEQAFVVDKYNRPMPKLRNKTPETGRYERRPAPPGTLNVAQLRQIILLYEGKSDDHNGAMDINQIAEKFRVDVGQVQRAVQFLSLPPENANKQKKYPRQEWVQKQKHAKGKDNVGKSDAKPKSKGDSKGKLKSKIPEDAVCFYCSETGHWKRNCPKFLEELKKQKAGETSASGANKK